MKNVLAVLSALLITACGASSAADAGPEFDAGPPPPECDAGQSLCGLTCLDTQTDTNNCGGCGNVCTVVNGTATCSMGLCNIGQCDAGYANCSGNYLDGCNTHIAADPSNCGQCGKVCEPHDGGAAACDDSTCE